MTDACCAVFQPTTFGKYFLTRRLAVGGMAEVFAAKLYGADGFEKDLVIKQILPQYARDPEFVQSFVAEAKIAVSLNHSNIVGIYELGRVDGTYFIAMELVDGLDVFTLLEAASRHGARVGIGEALLVVEDVARGLDYAHHKLGQDGQPLGLVHRDLNPRNVLISREGEVKILDFGIAKVASGAAAMPKTRAGVVKGTTGYMSPEQAMGRAIDERTDIYQAGLLLYELLTGDSLFWRPDDETTRELMRLHHVRPPSERMPDVSPALDELVLQALERDPARRVASASEMVGRLTELRRRGYPTANRRALGHLVADLADRDRRAVERTTVPDDEIPSTLELQGLVGLHRTSAFSEVVSRAIEQTITGQVETIARAPSAVLEAISPRPVTGSEPIDLTDRQPGQNSTDLPRALVPRVSSTPPRAPLPRNVTPEPHLIMNADGQLEASAEHPAASKEAEAAVPVIRGEPTADLPEAPPSPRPRRSPWPIALVLLLSGAGIATAALWPTAPTAPAPLEPTLAAEPVVPPIPRDVPPEPVLASTAKTASLPDAALEDRPPPAAKAAATPLPRVEELATVAFGTRSCSSRVSVDGQVIARSTPTYDHKLSAGRHRVVLEGTGCPPIERPGSLRRVIPTVTADIEVTAGSTVKVIADFDRDSVIVRR